MSSFRDFLLRRGRSVPFDLALAMTGVRMGERLLLVGDDPRLFATLAARVGLTGRCAIVVASEAAAARVEAAGAEAGVLLEEVRRAALPSLPVGDGEFDVAVAAAGPTLVTAPDAARTAVVQALHRALRQGGRLIVVEGQPRRAFGLLPGEGPAVGALGKEGDVEALLGSAGFRPVRVLAHRAGQRFIEGLKSQK